MCSTKIVKNYFYNELSGREVSTEAGKIDILAKDRKGPIVVIELKASLASYSTLGQILSYMAAIKKELGATTVRGLIVAENFDKILMFAVTHTWDQEHSS
jgi:RecB family endonuclease NucS